MVTGTGRFQRWVWLFPFPVLLLVNSWLALSRYYPNVAPDEFAYLAHAHNLVREDQVVLTSGAHAYPFGYGLLLIPSFLLFEGIENVYRAALLTNALISSSTYFVLLGLLPMLGKSPEKSWSLCLVACLSPALLCRSTFTMSDGVFITFFCLFVLAGLKLAQSPGWLQGLGFVAASLVLQSLHERALGITLIVAPVYLLWLGYRRRIDRGAAAAGTVLVWAGFYACAALNQALAARMGVTDSWGGHVLELLAKNWTWLPTVLCGQVLYILISTLGLAIPGLTLVVRRIRRGMEHEPFVLFGLAAASIFSISILTVTTFVDVSPNYVLHGRYNEGFLLPLLFFGLGALEDSQATLKSWLAPAGLSGLLCLGFLKWQNPENGELATAVGSPALRPLLADSGILGVAALAAAFALLVFWSGRVSRAASMLLLASAFLYVSGQARWEAQATFAGPLVWQCRQVSERQVMVHYNKPWEYLYLQFALPGIKVTRGVRPPAETVFVGGPDECQKLEGMLEPLVRDPRISVWAPAGKPPGPGLNLLLLDSVRDSVASPTWEEGVWATPFHGTLTVRAQIPDQEVDQLFVSFLHQPVGPVTVWWGSQVLVSEVPPMDWSIGLPAGIGKGEVAIRVAGTGREEIKLSYLGLLSSKSRFPGPEGGSLIMGTSPHWSAGSNRVDFRLEFPADCGQLEERPLKIHGTLLNEQGERFASWTPLPFRPQSNTVVHFTTLWDIRRENGAQLEEGAYRLQFVLISDQEVFTEWAHEVPIDYRPQGSADQVSSGSLPRPSP